MEFDDEIKESAYMAVRESESSFSMYKIIGIADPGSLLIFTGINFGPDELMLISLMIFVRLTNFFRKPSRES